MRWLLALFLLLPVIASAQGTATLVADTVSITGETQLSASGNVEVFYDGTRLTAQAITYDRSRDTLTITGPILIRTPVR